ncbi:MAG: DUF6391 domain-containing protein [Chloroflexota bacterium]
MIPEAVRRIRRNHGLEHATIHVLSETHKNFSAQGNSTLAGFHLNVYGDVREEDVAEAVTEALHRLQQGQSNLAVHPNCGTVLVTTAVMSTVAAMAPLALEQRRETPEQAGTHHLFNALPGAMIAVIGALIVSPTGGNGVAGPVHGGRQSRRFARGERPAGRSLADYTYLPVTARRPPTRRYRVLRRHWRQRILAATRPGHVLHPSLVLIATPSANGWTNSSPSWARPTCWR